MSEADPLLGTLIDGRYRVDRVIGEGGFGTVYAAFHVSLGSPVALKVLKLLFPVSPEKRADLYGAFFDEARTLKRLRHPSIVAALDVGLLPAGEDGVQLPYLVMEWCGGPTLERLLLAREGELLSLSDAWLLFEPILDAIAYAHGQGVAHRDLKPSNVLLESEKGTHAIKPLVIDFGIAKLVSKGEVGGSGDTRTRSRPSPFTPRYAAPEQLAGTRTGTWTDVFALGLLFVELVIGKPPIIDDGAALSALISVARPTPKMFGVDVQGLEPVLERALALRPGDRYPDAAALAVAMRAVMAPTAKSTDKSSGSSSLAHSESAAHAPLGSVPRGATHSSTREPVELGSSVSLSESVPSFDGNHGRILGGRFRLETRSGAGGSSVVYRATNTTSGELVALKIPRDPSAFDRVRFEREIEILSGVEDSRIVRYVAHGSDPETGAWLCMEWLEGETLAARLTREGVPISNAIRVAIELAETLGALHGRGIIHRDIKPSNIFLVDSDLNKPKLLDFGIARSTTHASITNTGALVGTVGYMSPEQVRGQSAVDQRSDVFSLGCVLFQCVTGHLPFEGDHPTEWLMKLALEEAPRADEIVSELPGGLAELLARMLQKNASARPASMREVALALRAIVLGEGVDPQSRRSVRAPAITTTERRFLSVVLLRRPPTDPTDGTVAAEVRALGATLHESPDGLCLVTFAEALVPTDLALSAGKLALRLARVSPSSRVVVLSTWLTSDRAGFKPVIEIATSLFDLAEAGSVIVDEATRSLLQGSIASSPIKPPPGTPLDTSAPARAHLLAGERAEPRRSNAPFVGREREVGTIVRSFEHAFAERTAEVVLTLGPAGIGKSRLAHEARARILASFPQVTVLFGSAESGERAGSLGVIRSMLRRFFSIPHGVAEPDRMRPLISFELVNLVHPEALELEVDFLCELLFSTGTTTPSSFVRAARAEPRLMTDQLNRAVDLWLRGLALRGPLLILAESMHEADEASVTLIDRFLGTIQGSPILLIGTGRPETTERFPTLFSERSVTTIQLRELVPRAATELTRGLLPNARDTLVRRVVELGGGNPILLEELARAVREGNDRELPDSVLALSQSRLDRLTERERRYLRAASVFGDRFLPDGVGVLLGGSGSSETLASLSARDVVRRVDPTLSKNSAHAFQSSIVREVAYASIPEPEAARAHLRAADYLESVGETRALELAFQCDRGGAPLRAAAWYLRAARQSLEVMDLPSAARWGDKALALDPRPAWVGAALCLRAQVEEARWAWTDAKRFAREAMEVLTEGSVLWFMAAQPLIPGLTRSGEIDAFLELAARLRQTPPMADAVNTAVLALANASNVLALGDHLDEARETLACVDALEPRLPKGASGLTYALMARGGIAMKLGDLGAYRDLRYAAASRFEMMNDWRRAIEVRGTGGFADCLLGRYEEALATLSATAQRATEYRMTTVHYLRHNVGLVLFQLGRYAEARDMLESTLKPLHDLDPRLERGSMQYLARTLVALGQRDLAERHARAALEGAERPNAKMAGRGDLAHVLLAQGRWSEALVLAEEAAASLTNDGPYDEFDMFIRVALIRSRSANGDVAGARTASKQAKERLAHLAARIVDPAYKKSFLEDVVEHAALRRIS